MRILYIIPSLQHPKVRGPHRHYHFVRELSKRHSITLLALIRGKVDPSALEEVRSYTEDLFTFNVNGESPQVGWADPLRKIPVIGKHVEQSIKLRGGLREMKEAFCKLVSNDSYDLVCFHGKSVYPVIKDHSGMPIVTDFCDATSMRIRASMDFSSLLKKPLYFFKSIRMRQLEKKLISKSDDVAFISRRDREAILGSEDRSEILPLGVDEVFWKRKSGDFEPQSLIFTGVMDYAPNHDTAVYLVTEILPRLQKKLKNIKLFIVGRNPKPELLTLVKEHPEVEVTGFVDDVRPYLERAAAFVAPMRFASGTQNKVLEAMAMQVPVITTQVVSDGLFVNDGEELPLLCAGDDEQFADCVLSVLSDKEKRSELADEGRRFVEQNFNWARSAEKLEQMFENAISAAS